MKFLPLLLCLPAALAGAVEPQPDDTVAALWRALSHAPGVANDTAALHRMFHSDAIVVGGRYRDGQATVKVTKAGDFIEPMNRVPSNGFFECEVARDLKVYDRFATAYSIVESRTDKAKVKADFVGVNSIQLYKTDEGWKIMSLYYHVEKPGLAIPLGAGKPGVCLN